MTELSVATPARSATRPIPPSKRGGARAPDLLEARLAALAAWADTHKPDLKVVAQRRDVDGPMVNRALEIVRRFIVDRGLILFGGLAIDYALRLRGSRIYPDDERPDFDVLSPRSVDDAYDLADLLRAAGFEGVGAIRGIHVQTMKVRTDFIWVADIGYAPRVVFDRIPVIEYRGMRVVHPDFQRMDMHLAFCFPFNNPPLEDVYHRWQKDLTRFNLFEKFYPVTPCPDTAPNTVSNTAPNTVSNTAPNTVSNTVSARTGGATEAKKKPNAASSHTVSVRLAVPFAVSEADFAAGIRPTVALHGFAAYAILRDGLDAAARAMRREPPAVSAPRLSLRLADARNVAVECPAGCGGAVHVAAPHPEQVVEGLEGDPVVRDPYMDLNPDTTQVGDLVVLSTHGRLLSVSYVAAPPGRVAVVSPQYLLLHFLFEAHRAGADGGGPASAREVYRAFYGHTLEILRAAASMFAEKAELADVFMASPFAPSVHTLGDVNTSPSYIIKMATASERLKDTPPAVLGLDPGVAGLLAGLPQNYYPPKARPAQAFDYDRNPLFRRAGLPKTKGGGDGTFRDTSEVHGSSIEIDDDEAFF